MLFCTMLFCAENIENTNAISRTSSDVWLMANL